VRAWFGDRFGTFFGRRTALARFAQFCADLLEAGLAPASALRIAGFSTRSPRLRRSAWRLAGEIERGDGPSIGLRSEPLTHAVLHALRADMSAGSRIRLLHEISRCHSDRVARRLSWTRGIIEPLAICFIGAVVGGTVLALFMPLISLVSGLSQ
jgi:type IV pilus assembly protein PilC